MITINARLSGHELILVNAPQLASDSVQFDRIHFEFDDSWDGYNAIALFWGTESDTPYGAVVDIDGYAVIPSEVLSEKSTIRFGVYGESSDDLVPRVTSTIVKYKVAEGAWSEEINNPGEATDDMVDQLRAAAYAALDNARTIIDTAESVIDAAEASQTASEAAQAAAESASQSASVTSDSAQKAARDASAALQELRTVEESIDQRASAVETSVANLIANGDPFVVKTLWEEDEDNEEYLNYENAYFDHTDNLLEYDYLDVYMYCLGEASIERIDVRRIVHEGMFSVMAMRNYELTSSFEASYHRSDSFSAVISLSANRFRIYKMVRFSIPTGEHDIGAANITTTNASPSYRITKVVGWKLKDTMNPDGFTTKDNELIDIRVGVDGTNYASAGVAVRAQINAVNDGFNTVFDIRGAIAANTDIDTDARYRQPGMYSVANSAASTITGWPPTLAANVRGGVLEVINGLTYPTISSGGVVQVVTAYMSNAIHRLFRLYIGNAWQPWTNLATDADVASAISTALGDYVTDTDLASELSGYFGMRQTLAANANADTLFQPGTYYISNATSSSITGWPFAPRGGLLITVNAIAYPFTSSGGAAQMAICYRTNGDTVAAYRQYIGGAWQSWTNLATDADLSNAIDSVVSSCFGIRGSIEQNTDIDTFFQPGAFNATNAASSTILNWPFAPRGGVLIVANSVGYPMQSSGGVIQIALCYRTNGETMMAYRQYVGDAWQSWHIVATDNNIAPVDNRSFNIFRRFVTIGDSMSRGQVYANPATHGGVRRDTHLAWGNRIATELGTEWIDQGAGGMDTREYINGFTESNGGVTRSIDDTLDGTKDAPAYVIGLGVNDDVSGTALGSLSDFTPGTVPSTKPSLSATFYAAYGYIVNRILEHYDDKVYIYLLTIPYYPTQTDATNLAKNTAIRAIAEAFHTAGYHVYCADMAQRYANWYRPNGKLYGCWSADHLTGLGYSVSAELTLRTLNDTIQTYAGEYYDADFIASNMA